MKITNILWTLGIIVAFIGGFIHKFALIYGSLIFLGLVLVYFNKETTNDLTSLYKNSNPDFTRYGTLIFGIILILFGILGFLGIQFGAR